MMNTIWLGLFAPLAGFLILMISSHVISRRMTEIIACLTIFISFICFITMDQGSFTLFNWIPIEGINAKFNLNIDHLSTLMALIITGIGFLIHVYSIGYMDNEEDFARYFACLNFFVFSMLLLVLSGDLVLLFVGWEGVGLASYLLIGYWYTRPAAAHAATKAFVVNRIGDLGLMLALLLTFVTFGTSDILQINDRAAQELVLGGSLVTILTLLFFCGSIGKSAQFPLHVWLPDAMEGPTPVSALIHAATMVTAGVYLVVRLHPLFILAPETMQVIGFIGIATSLFAALCAAGQTDLKRVLAYSTVSQLGLMFLACSVGAFYAAMFHLTTHAFVKALLFLSAGNVVHAMHGSTEMEKMGGLRKKLPWTHILFLIGTLALSGIPPLSAFFSKDLILELEHLAGFDTYYYIGLLISVLTAFYLTRAYCLTFLGSFRIPDKILKVVHEVPTYMLVPVMLLAILSISGGFLGFSCDRTPVLESFLVDLGITKAELELTTTCVLTFEMIVAICAGLVGIVISLILYQRFRKPITILKNAFYVDQIYQVCIVTPLEMLAKIIDGLIEPKIFDGMIRGVSYVTHRSAHGLQLMQSGQIRSYIAWMVLGMVLIIVFFTI
jgi:NADH-quinone oxidoreductase subunit L